MIDINRYKLLKNKVVLYIEDDEVLQSNIKQTLSNFFKEVIIAKDGDEAYNIYIENQNRIDLIITDINMPNTDGITLSKYIRDINKSIHIIIISAYTDTDYLLDSIDLNIIKYITKPLTTKKLFSLLDRILEIFNLDSLIVIGESIKLDYESKKLILEDKTIDLTKKETIFLKLLSENSIVTYEMMYEYMWDYDNAPSSDAIKSFIRKLNRKLPIKLFKNKHSIGYYID